MGTDDPGGDSREDLVEALSAALSLIADLRARIPSAAPLPPPRVLAVDGTNVEEIRRFLGLAAGDLEAGGFELDRVARLFGLSRTELGALFGVTRQAATQWLEAGVPAARAAKLNAVARLADVLERNLKRERIPGIVRTPAERYGGLTMLAMIEQDRHEELLGLVEDAFDWAGAA